MSGAVDMSHDAIAARELDRQVQSAKRVLLTRVRMLQARAKRAGRESHERDAAVAVARHLYACATALEADRSIQRQLQREDLLVGAGWKRLAGRIVELHREQRALLSSARREGEGS